MTDIRTRTRRDLSQVVRSAAFLFFCCGLLFVSRLALADTMPALFSSFAGNVDFVGTEQTLRTQSDNGDSCAVVAAGTTTSATLSGIPAGAAINAAYLYWAGSSTNITTAPDYDVIFEGGAVSAAPTRRYTATYNNAGTNLYYFSGVADVTVAVSAKGNGSYSFSGLSVNTGAPHCASSAVVAGWALLVVYSHPGEDFRVLNVFEGFQAFRGSSIMLTPNNFRIPVSPINGKHAYITWEGDVGNSGSMGGHSEGLEFNGSVLSDVSNPPNNQFNSVSTMRSPVNTASHGVDFDVYDIGSFLTAGETSAISVYSSGGDLVLLSSEVISVTNTPVADLGIGMTRNTILTPGQNATYTLNVSNNGPNAEPGPITVTDTLPNGMAFVSGSGAGWACGASGQAVTCTSSGGLASGAAAAPFTLTVAVAPGTSWSRTNTATVTGTAFDNVAANNSATDTYTISADLAIAISRSGSLTPGANVIYAIGVSNGGPSDDPGPVTVSDMLPASLSYVSASGAGWSCSASGQNVTCTRSGSFPAGGSAPLTLTAAVAANASGAIVNTVSVTGTSGLDSNTANNTATDSYVFSPYAYYAMDEASWASGTVTDSSANARHGSRLGSASATGYPPTVGSAIAGNPGTCGAGAIPAGTGSQGVGTPIDINGMGNAGTIAFWYRSNSAWDDGVDRMLLDASNNFGGGSADKHFYLAKGDAGELRFGLEDDTDDNVLLSSPGYSFAAGQWHHIAIAWDWGAGRMYLYLDGSQVGSVAVDDGIGNYSTLHVGGAKTGINGGDTDYTSNSANGHIDEVYVYNSALGTAGIAGLRDLTHACAPSVNHYELSLPTSSVSCLPTTVTVTACADSSSPCTNKYAGVSGQTVTLTASVGTLGSTTLAFDGTGMASTTLSHPAAADGTPIAVTLSNEQLAATNPRQCCPNGTNCTVANSCSTVFNTAGFIISNAAGGNAATIPAQVAGISSATHVLRAVRTNTTTKACESALAGLQTVDFAYECNDPTICYAGNLMSTNGGTSTVIARNNNGSVSSYAPVNMTFDADGNAPFTFNYGDVGRTTLWVRKAAGGPLLSALAGSSNAFATKPYSFVFSDIRCTTADADNCAPGALAQTPAGTNPAASGANGQSFIQAGNPFSVTITAIAQGGTATPSYGRETTAQGVALVLVPPSTGTAGALGGTTTIQGSAFNTGTATVNDLTWNEVGIIAVTATVKDGSYLDAGNVTSTSGNIGRFIPHHFKTVVSGGMLCPTGLVCPTDFNGITYSNQPFTTNVIALNAGGDPTTNYNSTLGLSRAVTLTAWNALGSTAAQNPNGGTLSNGAVAATAFVAGETAAGTPGRPVYALPNPYPSATPPPGPTDIYMRAVDADGVSSLRGASSAEGGIKIVSGRIWIANAHGSELLRLPVALTAQYWNGTNYVTSNTDDMSSFAVANVVFSDWRKLYPASSWDTGSTSVSVPAALAQFGAGTARIILAAPGASRTGSVRLTTNGNGTLPNTVDYLPSNTARATFGIYKGNDRFIYLRENY